MSGHNYTLSVTTKILNEIEEKELVEKIESVLIKKIHSRDLSLHVDFLKNVEITDSNILQSFWGILQKEKPPLGLRSLGLERDNRSKTTLRADADE